MNAFLQIEPDTAILSSSNLKGICLELKKKKYAHVQRRNEKKCSVIFFAKSHGRKKQLMQNTVLQKTENNENWKKIFGESLRSAWITASSERKDSVPETIEMSADSVPNSPKSSGVKKPVITNDVKKAINCAIMVPKKIILERAINLDSSAFCISLFGLSMCLLRYYTNDI